MGPKKKQTSIFFRAAFLAVAVLASVAPAAQSRFLRVLSLYKYTVYHASDRDVLCDFNYDSRENQKRPSDLGFDTLYDDYTAFDRSVEGDLGVRTAVMSGKKEVESSRFLDAGIRGNLEENATARTNTILALGDTTKNKSTDVEAYLDCIVNRKTHFGFKKYNGRPFWSLQGSVYFSARDERYNAFSSERLSVYGWSRSGQVFQTAGLPITVSPSIGWGWPAPVWPVYYAFEIERELRETGALTHELSDSTLIKIACLVAAQDAYTLRYDLPRKYFMADLDTLLSRDSVSDVSRHGMFAAFKVEEAINQSFPVFFSGFSAELFLWERIIMSFERNYSLYSGGTTPTERLNFDQENYLGLRGCWGFPMTGSLFCQVSVSKTFLSTDEGLLDHTGKNLLTWSWDAEAFYFVTNRFLVSAGVSGLDAWVCVPRRWPQRSYLNATVFMEDHFRLTLSLAKMYDRETSRYFHYYGGSWTTQSTSTVQSDNISLRIDYDY